MTNNIKEHDELIKLADDFLKNSKWKLTKLSYNPSEIIKLDFETLNQIKEKYGDVKTSEKIPNNSNRLIYKIKIIELYKLMIKINHIEGDGFYIPTGLFYYPPNGACGWHTNSNSIGKRIYLTYAKEENKSFFRYYDNNKEDIVTKYDKKGWTINKFNIDNEKNLFWHCVGSDTNRISIGFKCLAFNSEEYKSNILIQQIDVYNSYNYNIRHNIISQKKTNMFENFINGKYYYTLNKKKYVLNFIEIDKIFHNYKYKPIYVEISRIYWKGKKDNVINYHKNIDINFPVILLHSSNNPLFLEYTLIDGNERVSKSQFKGISKILAFVIDYKFFFKNLVEVDNCKY